MQLKGVITSMPTPFNENLTVSEETLVDEIPITCLAEFMASVC